MVSVVVDPASRMKTWRRVAEVIEDDDEEEESDDCVCPNIRPKDVNCGSKEGVDWFKGTP